MKLILSASSFQLGENFDLANSLLYKIAQYNKPFENATQFIKAVELHDELIYELSFAKEFDPSFWKYSFDPTPILHSVFEHHASFFIPASHAEYAVLSTFVIF